MDMQLFKVSFSLSKDLRKHKIQPFNGCCLVACDIKLVAKGSLDLDMCTGCLFLPEELLDLEF